MTELSFAEIKTKLHADMAKINADPAIKAADRLRRAAAERELVLLRAPRRPGKKDDAWEKEQNIAGDKDFAAYDRLVETVPTTAAGALQSIDVFLHHSLTADAIEEHPYVRVFLENIRAYLQSLRRDGTV